METTEFRVAQVEKQVENNTADIVDLKVLMAKQVEMESVDRKSIEVLEKAVADNKAKPAKIIEKVCETVLVVVVSACVSLLMGI